MKSCARSMAGWWFGALLASSSVLAQDCPNISGRYEWIADGASTRLLLRQEGCSVVHLVMESGEGTGVSRDLIPDGLLRPLPRNGEVEALESSLWTPTGLRVELREKYLKYSTTIGTHAEWTLLAGGELQEELVITRDGREIHRALEVYARTH